MRKGGGSVMDISIYIALFAGMIFTVYHIKKTEKDAQKSFADFLKEQRNRPDVTDIFNTKMPYAGGSNVTFGGFPDKSDESKIEEKPQSDTIFSLMYQLVMKEAAVIEDENDLYKFISANSVLIDFLSKLKTKNGDSPSSSFVLLQS